MSRFSYPHISVNSTLRDMCYASMESCFQGLSFIYLHLRHLNNLWGLYDPKTENMAGFLPIMEQHIELSAMPLLKDHIVVFISFFYTQEPWAVFQLWPKNMKILWWISSLSSQTSLGSMCSQLCKQESLFQWTGHSVASWHRHVQCSLLLLITGILTSLKMLIPFQLSVVYSFLSFASLYILTSHISELLCYIQYFINVHRFYCTNWLGVTICWSNAQDGISWKPVSPETERISQFSWYSDAVRIFKVQLFRSQQVLDSKDTRGIFRIKEIMTRTNGM